MKINSKISKKRSRGAYIIIDKLLSYNIEVNIISIIGSNRRRESYTKNKRYTTSLNQIN